MSNRAIQAMMRDPRKLMRFQLTGQLPREVLAPPTPLRELIEQIPPRLRLRFRGVKLHPELGFNSSAQFHNLEQLHTWLGGNQTLIGSQTTPYMSWQNRGFQKKLKVSDLLKHCSLTPSDAELKSLPMNIQ
ncbi:hypothetical protein ACU8KO_002498 [Vibrio alginolyticus]